MARKKDLATKITEITLKKSYNSLPLRPLVRTGNPFTYAESHGVRETPARQTSSKASVDQQKSTQK